MVSRRVLNDHCLSRECPQEFPYISLDRHQVIHLAFHPAGPSGKSVMLLTEFISRLTEPSTMEKSDDFRKIHLIFHPVGLGEEALVGLGETAITLSGASAVALGAG